MHASPNLNGGDEDGGGGDGREIRWMPGGCALPVASNNPVRQISVSRHPTMKQRGMAEGLAHPSIERILDRTPTDDDA